MKNMEPLSGTVLRFAPSITAPTLVWLVAMLPGCWSVPALPETLDVATSTSDRVTCAKDTGPAGLSESSWSGSRKADRAATAATTNDSAPAGPYGGILSGNALERPPVGEQMFVARFGSQGEMVQIAENRFFLADIYGADLPVGGEWVDTTLPGVSYRSASYGAQVDGRFGLAVIVHVRFANIFLGQAVLYSWGTLAANHLDGQFGYLLDFTDGAASSLGTIADQYPFQADRIVP